MEFMNFLKRSPDNTEGGGNGNLDKIKNFSNWQVPFYKNETLAIKHTASLLREKFDIKENDHALENKIIDVMQEGDDIELTDEIWQKIENTESYNIAEGEIEHARKISEKNHHNTKGFEDIRKKMQKGEELSMPTILEINDRYFLISGETRLLESRAYGTRVKVILGHLDVEASNLDYTKN